MDFSLKTWYNVKPSPITETRIPMIESMMFGSICYCENAKDEVFNVILNIVVFCSIPKVCWFLVQRSIVFFRLYQNALSWFPASFYRSPCANQEVPFLAHEP